jgi:hypothetical protein
VQCHLQSLHSHAWGLQITLLEPKLLPVTKHATMHVCPWQQQTGKAGTDTTHAALATAAMRSQHMQDSRVVLGAQIVARRADSSIVCEPHHHSTGTRQMCTRKSATLQWSNASPLPYRKHIAAPPSCMLQRCMELHIARCYVEWYVCFMVASNRNEMLCSAQGAALLAAVGPTRTSRCNTLHSMRSGMHAGVWGANKHRVANVVCNTL